VQLLEDHLFERPDGKTPIVYAAVGEALGKIRNEIDKDIDAAVAETKRWFGDPPLREWAGWDYETRTGRIRGAQAAVQILLPIIAAAVGMTLIGIIFHFAA
jgi:hypothetical protein